MEKEKPIIFKRNFYTSDDSGKIYIISLLAPLLVTFVLYLLGMMIAVSAGVDVEKLSTELWFIIPFSFVGQLTFLAVFLIYNKISKISNNAMGFKFKIGYKNVLIIIAVALISLFGLQYFVGIFDHILDLIGFNLNDASAEGAIIAGLPLTNIGWYFLNIVVLAVLPAICEELIFRGVVLSGLRKNFSEKLALVLSALMFAFMHGNLQQLIYPFLLGLILGWIVMRTGSVFSSMLVHFISNAIVITFAYIQIQTGWSMDIAINTWYYYVIAIALFVLTGVLIYIIDKFYFKHKNPNEIEKSLTKRPSVFLIVSWAVAGVLLLISTIMNFLG